MRIKIAVFISFWFCINSCSNDKSTSLNKEDVNTKDFSHADTASLKGSSEEVEMVKKANSRRIEFVLKVDAHAEEFDPITTVYVVMDNESNEVAAITGEGQIISKNSYKQLGIPHNALDACGAEYGGLGEYFYLIKNGSGEIELYKGWSDEHTIQEGKHWAKVEF